MDEPTVILIVAVVMILVLMLFIGLAASSIFSPWLRAFLSGGQVSVVQILGMRLRRTPVNMVLDVYLSLKHAGADVRLHEVESQYIAHKLKIYDERDLHQVVENYLKAVGRETNSTHNLLG